MKNKFIKSTLILLIGGLLTKVLGMIIRITMSRLMSTDGIGVYMLLIPTFSLLIAISQFGFPTSISKLVAENKRNNRRLVFSVLPISIILNIMIMFLCLFFGNFIAVNLIHEKRAILGLKCIGFVLPFISISSILRGYFFGREKMFPHVISNVIEDLVRLLSLIIGIPIFMKYGIEKAVMFVVMSNIISEFTSIVVLIFFLPKKISIGDLCPKKSYIKDVMSLSVPTTASRIIGNIGYFFEPIIFTSILLHSGFRNSFIVHEYGVISGYVMPLLLLPSFFTNAISQAVIPVISNSYVNRKYKYLVSKIKQAITFSLLIGIPTTILFLLFPGFFLHLIYNNIEGVKYLRFLSIFFLLFYIETPIQASLQAMGFSVETMRCTIFGVIIKLITLTLFTYLFGIWGLLISSAINILFVTLYSLSILKKKTNCLLL
ncbi:MAG: oligosaccharide flippase family protein [Bacilli bacterium]